MCKTFAVIACAGLMAGCNQPGERSFRLPTAPVDRPAPPAPPVTAVPFPTPPPLPPVHKPLPDDFMPLEVGQTFRTVVGTNPPECIDPRNPPGWPCQYFRLIPPADGRLLVAVTYEPSTQPTQGIDLTIHEPGREYVWAEDFSPGRARVAALVTGGTVYEVILWYTFPGLAYEVQTSIDP